MFAVHDPWESHIGTPVKVIESIALGVPVILNENCLVPEKLKNLCVVVKDCSLESVMKTLLTLMGSDKAISVHDYIDEYSVESIARNILLPAYREVVEGRR